MPPADEVEQQQKNPIECKIYRQKDGNDLWCSKQGFCELEIESRVKDVVLLRKDLPDCYKMIVDVTYELPKKDKSAQLGLVNRHGLITRINYASPFKGSLLPGDVILQVNGIPVHFDDKTIMGTVDDKQVSKTKNPEKKEEKKGTQDFKTVVTKILGSKTETKITIMVARLKTRVGTFKCPAGVATTPGYHMDLALVYQYKYLKLGLNMMQTGPKVVVNYTVPDTVAHISLNIGEAILAVDDSATSNLEDVRQKILDGCNKNGWCRLIVEYPNTDQMRNMVRGQLTTASKIVERPAYTLCGDVKKYCEEGIEALKNGKELEPVLKEEKKETDGKELEKKKSTRKANKKETLVEFRKTTDEFGIPSEWNSKLFVVLPPLKTKESESTENSQMNKK